MLEIFVPVIDSWCVNGAVERAPVSASPRVLALFSGQIHRCDQQAYADHSGIMNAEPCELLHLFNSTYEEVLTNIVENMIYRPLRVSSFLNVMANYPDQTLSLLEITSQVEKARHNQGIMNLRSSDNCTGGQPS
ncbi:hypothetical protein ACTFIU_005683 [Dictyostelium citrinum]